MICIEDIMPQVRDKFAHIDSCPFTGSRIFFENAGGALTLKSVVESSAKFAAIPDNQGRDNAASKALVDIISQAKQDAKLFLNATKGQIFVGESGTEVLFRMIRTAILAAPKQGKVIGSTLEHPASRSAAIRWAEIAGLDYISVPHDNETGALEPADYAKWITPDTHVATIIHTSPVTGMGLDIAAIVKAIRAVSPTCFIIVDGIQHAAHGGLDIDHYDIDGYAISPYKVFSRHGYGIGWISDRLSKCPHDALIDGPAENWELGTRDTGSYATFLDVVNYFTWLGQQFTDQTDQRAKIEAAANAIHQHENKLTEMMLHGVGNLAGLSHIKGVQIIGGIDNPKREGLVSLNVDGMDAVELVAELAKRGIRVHVRKADHYSGNILKPLGLSSCVRISLCHYNSPQEVTELLIAMQDIADKLNAKTSV